MSRSDYDDMPSKDGGRRGKGNKGLTLGVLICILVVLIIIVIRLIVSPEEKLEVLSPNEVKKSSNVSSSLISSQDSASSSVAGSSVEEETEASVTLDMDEVVIDQDTPENGVEEASIIVADAASIDIETVDLGVDSLNSEENMPYDGGNEDPHILQDLPHEEDQPISQEEESTLQEDTPGILEPEAPIDSEDFPIEEEALIDSEDISIEEESIIEKESVIQEDSNQVSSEITDEESTLLHEEILDTDVLSMTQSEVPPTADEIVEDTTSLPATPEITVYEEENEEKVEKETSYFDPFSRENALSLTSGLNALLSKLNFNLILDEDIPEPEEESVVMDESLSGEIIPVEVVIEEVPESNEEVEEVIEEEIQTPEISEDMEEKPSVLVPSDKIISDSKKEKEGDGVRIYGKLGSAVNSPIDGIVREAGKINGEKTISIEIESGEVLTINGFERVLVKKGERVKEGRVLGSIGASSSSSIFLTLYSSQGVIIPLE